MAHFENSLTGKLQSKVQKLMSNMANIKNKDKSLERSADLDNTRMQTAQDSFFGGKLDQSSFVQYVGRNQSPD